MRGMQTPLRTGIKLSATATDVARGVDLTGRVALVTGGASGLGKEAAKALSSAGADVNIACLDSVVSEAGSLGSSVGRPWAVDLGRPTSVDDFSKAFLSDHTRLDILVLNAGIMAQPLSRDQQGRESHFSTNHLGHFQLTARLWPALIAAGAARVIVMSSRAHQISDIDFDDLDFEHSPYDKWVAYGRSKTANSLFAVSLDRRGRGQDVSAFSVHPGMIVTPGIRHLSRAEFDAVGALAPDGTPVIDPEADKKTPEQGAATTVWCATSPALEGLGGVYCENCDIASVEAEAPFGVRPYAVDPVRAEKLWQMSAELTGTDIATA